MSYGNFNQYKQQSLNTMTSSELLIVLFDELVKRLKRSTIAIDNNQEKMFLESCERSREIINYLINTLDGKYEISNELYRMYSFFNQQIAYAISSKSTEKICEILPMIEEMRDTWKQAQNISKVSKSTKQAK